MTQFKLALALQAFLLSALAAAAAPSAAEIISKVDEIRNPAESYEMKVEVRSQDSSDISAFDVSIQGNNHTLVKTLEPPRDRGRNMLMLDEDMWVFIPNLKRAVRVSLSQRLSGQAANGDISRMRWSGDYTPKLESETPSEWVILLTANKKGLTYDQVRAWVDKKTFHPNRAEFLTLAGKPLKKATYQAYKNLAGKMRPSEIVIQDAVRESEKSTIHILSMDVKHFPASLFNQNSLH